MELSIKKLFRKSRVFTFNTIFQIKSQFFRTNSILLPVISEKCFQNNIITVVGERNFTSNNNKAFPSNSIQL